jgi:putative Ca2+/H+ antiporter (TMEM165/GDT1 family)
VIAALAVAFLGQAANTEDPYALLNYGGGIAFVIVALAFFMRQNAKPRKEEDGQRTSQS